MTRVLFVYPAPVLADQPLGVLYLSAVLKRANHATSLFHMTPYRWDAGFDWLYRIKGALLKQASSFRPDIAAFSTDSTRFRDSLYLARALKRRFDIPVIMGGAHPTADPKGTASHEEVDYVCVGEGEEALLELCEGEDPGRTANIYPNEVRPLIQDLDSLPFPDRDILDRKILTNSQSGMSLITSRGCPFQCAHCANACMQKLYRGKGSYIRYRSVDSIIEELQESCRKYGTELFTFADETFTMNRRRILEFLAAYKKEIALPFICLTRVGVTDFEVFKALKEAGCISVSLGVEAGNERIRREVLKRNISNGQILTAFSQAKEAGLRTCSFNMLGIPGETEHEINETISLNREVKPDLVMATIFMPFKGTTLGEECEAKGWVKGKIEGDYYKRAVCDTGLISPRTLKGYAATFQMYVSWPKPRFPFIHAIRKAVEVTSGWQSLYIVERFALRRLAA